MSFNTRLVMWSITLLFIPVLRVILGLGLQKDDLWWVIFVTVTAVIVEVILKYKKSH